MDCSGLGSCGGAEMGFGYGGEGIGVQFRRLVGEFWGKEMDSQRHFQRSSGCLMTSRLRTQKKEPASSKANEMLLQFLIWV